MRWAAGLVMVWVGLVAPAHAVYQTVRMAPIHAGVFSGYVLDGQGGPVGKARVSLIPCGRRPSSNGKELAYVLSDEQGGFAFDHIHGKVACMRFTAVGFNPLEVEVHRVSGAPVILVQLPIGG